MIGSHLRALSEKLDIYSSRYNNFIILGNFNIEMKEQQIEAFCDNYGLKSLIRQPTWYKSLSNPTCIDLVLLTHLKNFKPPVCWRQDCQILINDSDSYEKDF